MAKKTVAVLTILALFSFSIFFTMAQINQKGSEENPAEASKTPLPPLKNPSILIKKKDRQLFLYDDEKLIKTYNIALGFSPDKDKETEGDGRTPEGEYFVFTKNPKSQFYLSLGISYPSIDDAKRGLRDKLITKKEHDEIIKAINEKRMPPQKTRLGGEIYIHGGGNKTDWTWGCAALENEEIKELFDVSKIGMKVRIAP